MKYDVSLFKKNYGRKWINLMVIELIALILAVIMRLSNIELFFEFSIWLIGLIPIVCLPLTYCLYLRAKRQSERQRQWFNDGILYVERCLDNGFTAGGFVRHKETVIFDEIHSVNKTKYNIIITGNIQIIEQYNGISKEKKVNKYLIPRNFTEEENILKLGGYYHD